MLVDETQDNESNPEDDNADETSDDNSEAEKSPEQEVATVGTVSEVKSEAEAAPLKAVVEAEKVQESESKPERVDKGVTEKRRYPCPDCPKSYTAFSHLKDHRIGHTGEFPFSCDECKQGLKQLATLQKHSCNPKETPKTEDSVQALLPSVTIKKISEKIPENRVDKVLDNKSMQTPSETENLWVSVQSLPAGWRLSHKETEEGVKTTLFQTREGRVMNSGTQAFKYLTTETEIYTKQDIDRMKEGLAQDGWFLAHSLPAGWMRKTTTSQESGEVRTIIMNPNYKNLKSVKNVISYMKLKRYSVDVIDRFRKEPLKPEDESKTISPKRGLDEEAKPASPPPPAKVAKTVVQPQVRSRNSGPDWQEGDSTLPQGWKKRFNSGRGVDQILSPHGHVFRDRAEGLKYIMENNRVYSEQDRKDMEDRLGCEGWETEPLLPQGWKLRKVDGTVQFLTEVSSKIKIVKSARENIRKNHGEEELKHSQFS